MDEVFLLSEVQFNRIRRYFPLSHGVPRVDDLRVVSGIIYVIKHGLQWKDAPKGYGPHKTLYNRFMRWSRMGVFNRVFTALASQAGDPEQLIIDATHLKAHRTAASLPKKRGFPRLLGRTKGGLNSKLHAVTDPRGRPIRLLLTAGQVSDFKGAALLLDTLPKAKTLLGDRGYDANWFRNALKGKGINPCIPSKRNRKVQIEHDKILYKQRHKVENMFAKLKDWRRVHTRYDRCAHTFFSAILIAATVIFWL
ncbi:IS5 family transposase [Asticcacaulis sp. AND118]|uniref:IS5 family transposase n=1 Tax=Asticcacaulis sp. AND118 TaxID=2840468 RepID=UPI00351D171C